MAPDQLYNELVNEFHKNYIFFIPSKIVPDDIINGPELTKIKDLLDRVLVIDNTFQIIPIEQLNSYIDIINKAYYLDKNIFKLLDKKGEISDFQFNFILEKYYEQVEFYYQTTEFYLSNLSLPIFDNINDTIKGLFTIQHNNYKKHLEELNKQFYPDKTINSQVENDFSSQIISNLNSIGVELIESPNNNIEESEVDELKTLSHYIQHKNRKEIETAIVNSFLGARGKKLRCIVEFLVRENLISLDHGQKLAIFNALKNTFKREIGDYTSMWGYEVDKFRDKTYIKIKSKLKVILKDLY